MWRCSMTTRLRSLRLFLVVSAILWTVALSYGQAQPSGITYPRDASPATSASAATTTQATAAELTPLAVEAPDSPVAPNARPASTSPVPVHTSAFFHSYPPPKTAPASQLTNPHS